MNKNGCKKVPSQFLRMEILVNVHMLSKRGTKDTRGTVKLINRK